jgi:pilus assembly protein Flp/PilA
VSQDVRRGNRRQKPRIGEGARDASQLSVKPPARRATIQVDRDWRPQIVLRPIAGSACVEFESTEAQRGTIFLNGRQQARRSVSSHGVCQMSKVFAFLKDESGTTAIEYGLIAAGISVVIIATVNAIGVNLNAKFQSVSTQLK